MRRYLIPAWLLTAALVLGGGLLAGCGENPDLAHGDNPFDPTGDFRGDPLQLRAVVKANEVVLTWNNIAGVGITEYNVFRSNAPDAGFESRGVLAPTAADTMTFSDRFPPPTQTHWYRVQAIGNGGDFSLTSLATPASAVLGPTVIVADTASSFVSRYTDLTVYAAQGDSLRVWGDSLLAEEPRVAVAGPGLPTVVPLDLGPRTVGAPITLNVQAFGAGFTSAITTISQNVGFRPQLSLAGGAPLQLARRTVDLVFDATGVVQMRFSPSEAGLAAATWLPPTDGLPGYELADSANPQEIWAEFESDFGFATTTSLSVRPNLLQGATFALKVPADRIVSQLTVVGDHTAVATEMRVSENPNFADVPWVAYADTAGFVLSPAEGTKTVYAQYRNDWTASAIFSDWCILVSQGIDVNVVAPAEGSILEGGSTLVVRGTSTPGTVADALDSLAIDFGDGLGFREVIGTDNWQVSWSVPLLNANTTRVIRARAWAGEGAYEATDLVTVTISQLTVNIAAPIAGSRVTGGSAVTVSGNATPFLAGAPVDSVVVMVDGVRLDATGTAAWNATWDAPAVAADTPATITATAWADGDTASRAITVTVAPPE